MTDEARPVLMSRTIAELLGVLDRWRPNGAHNYEGGSGIASITEAEILAMDGVERVEWGEPDHGIYTPTIYSKPSAAIP